MNSKFLISGLVRVLAVIMVIVLGLSFIFDHNTKVSAAIASPTFVQEAEVAWNSAGASKTTASFNVLAGDILVAYAGNEGNSTTLGISGGSLTWTQRQAVDVNGYAETRVWTATVDTNKSMAVTFTNTNGFFGGDVLTFRGSSGVGASAKANASGAPTLNITTTQTNSAVVMINTDWKAVDGAARTYRNNAGSFNEQTYYRNSTFYAVYGGFYPNVAAAGANTVGLSAPASQKYSIIAVEIKGIDGTPDTTAPTVSVTAPADGATVSGSSVQVSANASDDIGVAGVQFRQNGINIGAEDTSAPYSVNLNTTALPNGARSLSAVARDAAGNTTTSSAVTVTIANPPVISGISATSLTQTSAQINWTTNIAADSQVNFGLDSSYGSSTTLDTNFVTSHAQTLSNLNPGTVYHYQVLSREATGILATSGDNTFTTLAPPDTEAPTVSFDSPVEGATVAGSTQVTATASDNVAVVGVQFKLDGANLGFEDVASPFSATWNTATSTNGSHILSAVARDAAGNSAASQNVNVNVFNTDTTPPVISSIAASSITSTGSNIGWATNEPSDSQVEYGTTISYGSSSALNPNLVNSHSVSLGGLAASTLYHYRVKSKDAAGNLATSSDFTFTTSAAGNALTINGNTKFQIIDGFGTNINSLSWTNDNSQQAIDMLADQMGQTTWRVVFDMEDWEATNDNSDPNVADTTYYNALYSNAKFQNLWGTLHYLNSKGFNSTIALSFMGRVPTWMGGSTINTASEDEAVEMITTLVDYARNTEHVQFGMLDPFNETDLDGIEGPQLDSTKYVRLLHKISDKLDSLGLSDIRFMGPNTANIGTGVTTFMPAMMADSVVANKTDHFAFHSYGAGTGGADSAIKNSAYPNKNFWITEYTTATDAFSLLSGNPAGLMIWEGFDSVFNHAILAGRGSQPGSDDTAGPAPIAYNATTHTYTPRSSFYQDAAIFKFVPPGSQRIGASESVGSITVYSFYNSTTGRFTTVGQNTSSAVNFTGTISNIPSISSLEFYRADTSALTRLTDVSVSNQVFSFTAPANSVFTLTGLASIDTTSPSAPSNLTAAGSIGQASLSWTAATDNIGVAFYNVYRSTTSGFTPLAINRIGSTPGTSFLDSTTAGTYYYLVSAADAAGNISPVSNEATTTIQSDTTPPTVAITAPTDGATVSNTVTINANATDNVTVMGVQFKIDGNNFGAEDTVAPYSVSWTTTSAMNGPHTITAQARDAAGNTSTSSTVNVTVNTVAPSMALVQQATNNTAGATSLAKAFTANVTAGNLIVVAVSGWPTPTINVTDSRGNAYAVASPIRQAAGSSFSAIYYAKNITGGADTVTVSANSSVQLSMVIAEFSGLNTTAPLDGNVSAAGTSNTPSSGNVTPTTATDLLIGAGTHNLSTITSAGSGFTLIGVATEDSSNHQPLAMEYKFLTSTSPVAATFSLPASGDWSQNAALFKP
jgi:O-glycosyl hydrolase